MEFLLLHLEADSSFMGLRNKSPPVVEAKTYCESAKKLKTKLKFFLVNIYFAF